MRVLCIYEKVKQILFPYYKIFLAYSSCIDNNGKLWVFGIGGFNWFAKSYTIIFVSKKNVDRLDLAISELTNVNHMALIIGLYLLTIGTFLGAVWANESWG